MGWTGGEDTLAQIELTFRSDEEAIAYARRQGLEFVLHGLEDAKMTAHLRDSSANHCDPIGMSARSRRLECVERTLGQDSARTAGIEGRALLNPASCFGNPEDVLRDPRLSKEKKREILRRWALDAYLIEVAATEGVPEGAPSRLEAVIDALIDLDDAEKLPAIAKRASAQTVNADLAA
jgi:hypothetical protein